MGSFFLCPTLPPPLFAAPSGASPTPRRWVGRHGGDTSPPTPRKGIPKGDGKKAVPLRGELFKLFANLVCVLDSLRS